VLTKLTFILLAVRVFTNRVYVVSESDEREGIGILTEERLFV
jgi:hypothetical protein